MTYVYQNYLLKKLRFFVLKPITKTASIVLQSEVSDDYCALVI